MLLANSYHDMTRCIVYSDTCTLVGPDYFARETMTLLKTDMADEVVDDIQPKNNHLDDWWLQETQRDVHMLD